MAEAKQAPKYAEYKDRSVWAVLDTLRQLRVYDPWHLVKVQALSPSDGYEFENKATQKHLLLTRTEFRALVTFAKELGIEPYPLQKAST